MDLSLISLLVLISILLIIALTTRFRIHAFMAIFIASLLHAAVTLPAGLIIRTMKEGFGGTMASIGFLIIFGANIGYLVVAGILFAIFWVVTNFSDTKVGATLMVYPTSTIDMRTVVFACVWVIS